ncbi:hypothetical protein NW755_009248 [Fusarium falciforme]|uniref:Uncharacterized protein n=1 Tax=Fusarium falciforme TaxID=195108 RepID=A0A9W8R0J5_9HYPO|nr:hypothetical protein NW755_009248 [Fusarium falciforme]
MPYWSTNILARYHSKADHPIDGRSKQARKTHAAGLDPPPARSARLVLQLARFKRGTPAPAEHRDIENLGLGQPSFFHLPRKNLWLWVLPASSNRFKLREPAAPEDARTHAPTHRDDVFPPPPPPTRRRSSKPDAGHLVPRIQ